MFLEGENDPDGVYSGDCINQSVEIDDSLVTFIDLSLFLPISSIGGFFCASDISLSLEFVQKITLDFIQIVRF